MAAGSIRRLNPVPRQQGVPIPDLIPIGQWIDARVMVAGVARSYTLPIDTAPNPDVKGTFLRITSNAGPIYVNFVTTASVPADVSDGSSSIMLRTDLRPVLLAVPGGASAMSIISPGAAIVTIEAWS